MWRTAWQPLGPIAALSMTVDKLKSPFGRGIKRLVSKRTHAPRVETREKAVVVSWFSLRNEIAKRCCQVYPKQLVATRTAIRIPLSIEDAASIRFSAGH